VREQMENDRLKRIEDKLDKISDKLGETQITLAANTTSLIIHEKRTDIAEKKLNILEKELKAHDKEIHASFEAKLIPISDHVKLVNIVFKYVIPSIGAGLVFLYKMGVFEQFK
jgi:thiamine phosphate synthase YjbQ (UPF0047 family)